jgi:type II secretory ATPase GspE/PulE/Tfp pilus assembly ATPase PilB-like protein
MPGSSSDALRARAAKLGYPVVDLAVTEVPASVLELVPERVARQYAMLPIALEGEVVRLAAAKPPTPATLDQLRHAVKRPVAIALTESDVPAAIEQWYTATVRGETARPGSPAEEPVDFMELEPADDPGTGEDVLDPDDSRVVQAVQVIIADAWRFGASRILIVPMNRRLKVAYRIQDVVCARPDLPGRMHYSVLARLMTMANLYGQIKVAIGRREQRLRIAFHSAKHGLSAVLDVPLDPALVDAYRTKAVRAGYRFVALGATDTPRAEILGIVPAHVAKEEWILPLGLEGEALLLAAARAPTPETMDRLHFLLNRRLAVALAPEGALRAAIERCYGPSDHALLDAELWREAGEAAVAPPAGPPVIARIPELADAPARVAAAPLVEHLRGAYQEKTFELFESLAQCEPLCEQDPVSGDLKVRLPHAHVAARMPVAARRCLENKIWALREAILSRLENFLEKDGLARAVAMSYSQYLACCEIARGNMVSINPATNREAWINFAYALALRAFPTADSHGALLGLLAQHAADLSERIASLIGDPEYAHGPGTAKPWLARLTAQTTTDEAIDFDSPPIVHLLELLIAEAVHLRAAAVAIVPLDDRVEVAYRIHRTIYRREGFALYRLYPLLARLRMLAEFNGKLRVTLGNKERHLCVRFQPTECGLASVIEILPDVSAAETCKAQAAHAGHPFVALEDVRIPGVLLGLLPKAVAWKKTVLPLEVQGTTLTVVVSSPPTPRRLDELRLIFNNPLSVAMAPEDEILAAIYRHYHPVEAERPASRATMALLS